MSNITDLRAHLMDTLAALKDKDNPMDVDRARAVAQVASVIVDTAKVEVDFLKVTGAAGDSGFLGTKQEKPTPGAIEQTPTGLVHRLRG
ncbi:conserved protein of unknown function [Pararobbsia alpina]|uniref:hypothetical protein n=1 Tax=Pararobbsia alpina TaxID=621374 RepID=UPI0039A508BF